MDFTEAQLQRYARHIILPEVGGVGQARLIDAKVLVIGAGGLGSPVLMYLAAAGVGTLGVVDFDRVDLSNLQRQIVHATSRVGEPKTESARATLAEINPEIDVVTHEVRLTAENALEGGFIRVVASVNIAPVGTPLVLTLSPSGTLGDIGDDFNIRRIVERMPDNLIKLAIHDAVGRKSDKMLKTSAVAYFVGRMKNVAQEQGMVAPHLTVI